MYLAHYQLENTNAAAAAAVVTDILMTILVIAIIAAGIYGVYTGVLRH